MICKGKTYIKGTCKKCPHYGSECDPVRKTPFKKAQEVFNNYIYEEVEKSNEFRAKEESLIKQRVTKLENQMPYLKDYDIAKRIVGLEESLSIHGDNFRRVDKWLSGDDPRFKQLESKQKLMDEGLNIHKKKIHELQGTVVSLQLKLDSLNLKVDYPVMKRKRGRPKKV